MVMRREMEFSRHLLIPPQDGTVAGLDDEASWSFMSSKYGAFSRPVWDPDSVSWS